MIAYLDSSVILRVVLGQPGLLREWRNVRDGVASALAEVECLRTLDRLRLREGLTDRELARRREAVFALLQEMTVVEPTRPVLSRASQPLPTPLGTLDAIHLATALLWRENRSPDLVLATHDEALALAGRACGLLVVGT
ncbi:MAG: PIN domain-containing protein [Planctomycetota bacterium]